MWFIVLDLAKHAFTDIVRWSHYTLQDKQPQLACNIYLLTLLPGRVLPKYTRLNSSPLNESLPKSKLPSACPRQNDQYPTQDAAIQLSSYTIIC